jgi:hypothetical protein
LTTAVAANVVLFTASMAILTDVGRFTVWAIHPSIMQRQNLGVADLGYEGLNMQGRETSIHKTWGFSSYFFHTLIKQRRRSHQSLLSIQRQRICGRIVGCGEQSLGWILCTHQESGN